MSARIYTLALEALLTASAATANAQATKLQWGPAPPFLPAGARFAVVSGDPGKPGPYAIQLSLPNGYTVPPHWHPTDEHVTVKSGHFRYGLGDTIDKKAMKSLRPGQSGNLPANMHHYAMARGKTVIAVNATDPSRSRT
jgi:quercetin dioxygenase-like cupin family protein